MRNVIVAAALALRLCMPARAEDIAAVLRDIKSGQKKLAELEKKIPHVRSKQFHRVNQSAGKTHQFDCYSAGSKTLIETADNRICFNEIQCFILKKLSSNSS